MSNNPHSNRTTSFESLSDTDGPLPTLQEEGEDKGGNSRRPSRLGIPSPSPLPSSGTPNADRNPSTVSSKAGSVNIVGSDLPTIRPPSLARPLPHSSMETMNPRSTSPPQPPPSSISFRPSPEGEFRSGRTTAREIAGGTISSHHPINIMDEEGVEIDLVPSKPQSDSKIPLASSIQTLFSPTKAALSFRSKLPSTFLSLSDITDSQRRNASPQGQDSNNSNKSPTFLVSDVRRYMPSTASGSPASGFTSSISRKSVLIRNTLTKRSTATLSRLGSRGSSSFNDGDSKFSSGMVTNSTIGAGGSGGVTSSSTPNHPRIYRGYSQGDMVLVISDGTDATPPDCTTTILVNQYGYPYGEGRTTDEQRGPYLYVLGKIKQIHYEENDVFYTITREDSGEDVRGYAVFMEPIHSQEGLDAARRAANGTNSDFKFDVGQGGSGSIPEEKHCLLRIVEDCCALLLSPFFWIYDVFVFVIGARLFHCGSFVYKSARNQANLFLNGFPPYNFSVRLTTVNIIVLCSMWFMFIDQMRLAFFPPNADHPLAVINFIIWTILVLELIFEVFIRPDGYFQLVQSDKAFNPTTMRYISGFHLITEAVSLGFFMPEFRCLFNSDMECGGRPKFSFLRMTLLAISGSNEGEALAGKVFYACVRLRVFGLVRHWRNMWIRKTFLSRNKKMNFVNDQKSVDFRRTSIGNDNGSLLSGDYHSVRYTRLERKQRDAAMINASNIGTALMVTNSFRSLMMVCLIMGIFPLISLIYLQGVVNPVGMEMVNFLQGTNLQVAVENSTNCQYFADSVMSWVDSFASWNSLSTTTQPFLLGLEIKPLRCMSDFGNSTASGIVFYEGLCPTWNVDPNSSAENCIIGVWNGILGNTSLDAVADTMNIRVGNIVTESSNVVDQTLITLEGSSVATSFAVLASYNYTHSTKYSALNSFLLQLCLLLTVLASLVMLRYDAEHLVLRPLRSMLKIVARYAKNPLAQATLTGRDHTSVLSESDSEHSGDDDASDGDGFGTYETEQLISAVSKITDLLRKCWGVAGADIISTNLASREGELAEVFNPTVPGKSVYALFAFAAVNGFDHALKCLAGDVMILINDVAQVLHGEVFRWGFGDSGQCNKNLGNAFLMVFRIGLVREVVEKLEEATRVVFSGSQVKKIGVRKRSRDKLPTHVRKASSESLNPSDRLRVGPSLNNGLKSSTHTNDAMADAMQLSLQSLPGISTFTDRAVIGMLKSFAGIHRDNKLRAWSRDFRLSAGVGAWSVNMIFGMDAGWAVEGAVGSEYKIDATYLSPHVNMASRMMSACKHYGVTILLSEAVQELMSDQARSRLRNVDRVTVKGSTQVQNLYTYDARSKGADFFLYSRSDEQADLEAERYQPNIWFDDQDLNAMRHHLTDDFEQEFMTGMKFYYEGNWPEAIERLEFANEIMVEAAMEEGYLHDEMDDSPDRKELYRTETADGPCKYLINFMRSQGGTAPANWAGWHPLLSK